VTDKLPLCAFDDTVVTECEQRVCPAITTFLTTLSEPHVRRSCKSALTGENSYTVLSFIMHPSVKKSSFALPPTPCARPVPVRNSRRTRTPAVAEKEPIVLTYLQFQTEVSFWCLFVLMQQKSTWGVGHPRSWTLVPIESACNFLIVISSNVGRTFSRYRRIKLENSLFSPLHSCLTPPLRGNPQSFWIKFISQKLYSVVKVAWS